MAEFAVGPRTIPRTGDNTPARSLLRYVWRMSGRHQISICLLSLVVAALSMLPLELQRRIIDDAIRESQVDLLIGLGGAYLGVLVVLAGVKFLLRMYQGWLSESAIRYNRQHLTEIHGDKPSDGETGSEGRVVSVVGSEIDRLGGFVGEGLSQPFVNVGMLLVIGGYMFVVEPVIALFSLGFLIPQVIAVPIVQRYVNRLLEARVSMLRDLSDNLVELRRQSAEEESESGLVDRLDRIYGNRMRTFLLKFVLKAFINLLNAVTPLVVLVVGGYLVIQGETTIGIVVAFISGFDRLANPLRELIAYYRFAAQANVQHEMIAKWMA